MTREARRMNFDEFAADLGRVLETLANEGDRILVEKSGRLYRVEREADGEPVDPWQAYDPARVRRALQDSAGALAGVNPKKLIADIHAARRQASHGRPT